jgi:phosphomevalonate kinase
LGYLVKAPGKLILIGEYAVLEGAPALVMAVNRYARVTFTAQQDNFFILHSPTLNIFNIKFDIDSVGKIKFKEKMTPAIRNQLLFFIETLQYFFQKEPDLSILSPQKMILDTTDFFLKGGSEKLGLGSSAALTVALLAGLSARSNQSAISGNRKKIFQWAQEIHLLVQGKIGSGIDIAASVYGRILSFQREQESYKINSLSLPPDLIILPVWSGKSASTTELVTRVNQLKLHNPEKYWRIFQQLRRISQEAIISLQEKNSPAFLDAVQQYFEVLKNLDRTSGAGIISKTHEDLAKIAYRCGAVYKTSGAGGGDIGLVLTNSRVIAQKVSDYILHSGYQILNLLVSKTGVTAVRRRND